MPEKIEHLLGDGARWGSRFRFHLARDHVHPYKSVKALISDQETEPVLLAHADQLPNAQIKQTKPAGGANTPVVYCWRDPSIQRAEDQLFWTGWAWVPPQFLTGLPEEMEENGLGTRLIFGAPGAATLVEVPKPLSVKSYDDLLASHRRVLAKEFPALMLSGKETDKGIWLSRNVSLHPTAQLHEPVYIDENCQVGAGSRLGPNVVIGKNCILDDRCIVSDSVIFPGSYVGQALELENVIVDKNCLVNVRVGAAVSVVDNFILGSISDSQIRQWWGGLLARLMAVVLLVLTCPVLLLTSLWLKLWRNGPVLNKREVVRLPASPSEMEWRTFSLWSFCPEVPTERGESPRLHGLRHFLLSFLPALVNIARGELRFVGVTPRTPEMINALPSDWKALYLRAKAGIVTEAFVIYGENPTEDELYSAEAFYSVSAGIRYDFMLLLKNL